MFRKVILFGAAVALVLTAAPAPAHAQVVPPNLDPFYSAPNPMPAGPPGTIIRSRPVIAQALPLLPVPVRAWQVVYKSTTVDGNDVAVSGIVLVPLSQWRSTPASPQRPIISYTTGTAGINSSCATSYQLAIGIEYETAIFGQALLRNWAVAITDYIGRGVGLASRAGPQHYLVGPEAAHAVLDMARAAQRLPDSGLSTDSQVGFWGYSEGGHAAAWAGELAESYAPDLNVAGIAAGGTPGTISEIAEHLDGGPFSGIMMLAAVGLNEAYDVALEEILNDAGRAAVALAKNTCVELTSGFLAFRRLSDFTTVSDPMGLPQWQATLAAVSTGQQAPDAPIYLYHGTWDELIPYRNARDLRDRYCDQGATVTWRPMYFVGHIVGVPIGAPGAVSWLDDRFDGKAARNSC